MSTCMPFQHELVPGRFRRRLNRFLVEADLAGETVLAHLHDPGRMKELLLPGAGIWLEPAAAPGRKTAYTVALVQHGARLVSVNSILPNRFAEFCLKRRAIHEFRDYELVGREVRHGRSRFDFHLMAAGIDILLEVKSVTLVQDGTALFPDAPTARGTRHVRELVAAGREGYCGSILFLVQRDDAHRLIPHAAMDPAFANALQDAFTRGIEIVAYTSRLSLTGIELGPRIPVRFPDPA